MHHPAESPSSSSHFPSSSAVNASSTSPATPSAPRPSNTRAHGPALPLGLGCALIGATVWDTTMGAEFTVRARGDKRDGAIHRRVPRARLPSSNSLSSSEIHKPLVRTSAGVHMRFPNCYSQRSMGLLDPATSDGRVVFVLPWQGTRSRGQPTRPCRTKEVQLAGSEGGRRICPLG
jgi:hypothetical protein